jgi:hypothetical protein
MEGVLTIRDRGRKLAVSGRPISYKMLRSAKRTRPGGGTPIATTGAGPARRKDRCHVTTSFHP